MNFNRMRMVPPFELKSLLLVTYFAVLQTLEPFVRLILNRFVLKASVHILTLDKPGLLARGFRPLCQTRACRAAATRVLVELSNPYLGLIMTTLATYHHRAIDTQRRRPWGYSPQTSPRSTCGYVGLKNAGATCYMNAVIQQLFMNIATRKAMFTLGDDAEAEYQAACRTSSTDGDDGSANPDSLAVRHSAFYELQRTFAFLLESDSEYFSPTGFWKEFKFHGQNVNVRQQQDANEFFQNLVDQIDEHLHKMRKPKYFESVFGGKLTDQKICKCGCVVEREEPFMSIQVEIHNMSDLHEGLQQYIKGDVLKGDNAYKCEKCDIRVEALKRVCIKTLPRHLVVHLKRFGYDWDRGEPIKYNDCFRFPRVLDMEPYTDTGLARREGRRTTGGTEQIPDVPDGAPAVSDDAATATPAASVPIEGGDTTTEYTLTGVVVHSGIANAGHYYSYIRDPDGTDETDWLQFNDNVTESCTMDDAEMETQWFGGQYTDSTGSNYNLPDRRERSWNGYLLFYERVDVAGIDDVLGAASAPTAAPNAAAADTTVLARQTSGDAAVSASQTDTTTSMSVVRSPQNSHPETGTAPDQPASRASLLVSRGNEMFSDAALGSIGREIHEANVHFLHESHIFSTDYFRFLYDVTRQHATLQSTPDVAVATTNLITNFILNTFLRADASVRQEWTAVMFLEVLFQQSAAAIEAFAENLLEDSKTLDAFLLLAPDAAVREQFSKCILLAAGLCMAHGGEVGPCVQQLLAALFSLLERSTIANNTDRTTELFRLYRDLMDIDVRRRDNQIIKFLVEVIGILEIIQDFLQPRTAIAEAPTEARADGTITTAPITPAWSCSQLSSFGQLYAILTTSLVAYDLTPLRRENSPPPPVHLLNALRVPHTRPPPPLLPLQVPSAGKIRDVVGTSDGRRRLLEVITKPTCLRYDATIGALQYYSWEWEAFSMDVVDALLLQLHDTDNMKPQLTALGMLLTLNDNVQVARFARLLSGGSGAPNTPLGVTDLFAIHEQDLPGRAYQLVKFVFEAAEAHVALNEVLRSHPSHAHMLTWLEEKLQNYNPDARTAFKSNDSEDSRFFLRTTSANHTLQRARNGYNGVHDDITMVCPRHSCRRTCSSAMCDTTKSCPSSPYWSGVTSLVSFDLVHKIILKLQMTSPVLVSLAFSGGVECMRCYRVNVPVHVHHMTCV
eukprot:m.1528538 g.1528538  ORF g.1528538 m.1528538 type:complete len:1185 (-) comp25238_c1_seq6:1718-5272(-)